MKLRRLLVKDILRSRRRLMTLIVMVCCCVLSLLIFGSVAAGLHRHVIEPLMPKLPLELLKVHPRTLSIGFLAFDTGSIGGRDDEGTLATVRTIEGVAEAYPVWGLRVPLRAAGGENLLGRKVYTDVFATGVPEALIKDDLPEGIRFIDDPSKPVPVVVARRLLELYNTTVAPAIGKPKLSASVAIGLQFTLILGSSVTGGSLAPDKIRHLPAQIVGVSDKADLAGITLPESLIRRWSKETAIKPSLNGMWVELQSPTFAGPVAQSLGQMGFDVDQTSRTLGTMILIGLGFFALFVVLLLSLAAFSIAQSFSVMVSKRRAEWATLRALGARKIDVFRMVMLEALFVGFVGSILGLLLGWFGAWILDLVFKSYVQELPFAPAHITDFPISLALLGMLLGVLSGLIGSVLPAYRASSTDPVQVFRGDQG